MTDNIIYVVNKADHAEPIYEVNYTKKTFTVVGYRKLHGYESEPVTGKIRSRNAFTNACFEPCEKPRAAA